MAPPDVSRWDTGTAQDAWFLRRRTATITQCLTDGWNFVGELRSTINAALLSGRPLKDWDERLPVPLSFNDSWDAPLLRGIYALGRAGSLPQAQLDAIRTDASIGAVSPATLRVAVALMNGGFDLPSGDVPGLPAAVENIRIPEGAIMPLFGVPLPHAAATQAGPTCVVAELLPTDPNMQFSPPRTTPFNPWVIFGVLAASAAGVAVLTADVPQSGQPRRRR